MNYCYSKVIYTEGDYYHYGNDADTENYEVQVIYEERGCRAEALSGHGSCTTTGTDIAGSNINVVTCDETCSGDSCNNDWPQRPKCMQCEGSFWSGGAPLADTSPAHWNWCALNPAPATRCPDPSYKYCYAYQKFVPDGDNEIKWGFSKEFSRGCLKEREVSRCWDKTFRDEKWAHVCQFICSEDDCNQGSLASGLVVPVLTLLACISSTRLV
jgi:hypothetical protein